MELRGRREPRREKGNGEREEVKTYVAPDGHDEDHRNGEGLIELAVSADLVESIAVIKGDGGGRAHLGGDLVGVGGDALDVGGGDLDGLAVLDEDLVHGAGLEAGDDATDFPIVLGFLHHTANGEWE